MQIQLGDLGVGESSSLSRFFSGCENTLSSAGRIPLAVLLGLCVVTTACNNKSASAAAAGSATTNLTENLNQAAVTATRTSAAVDRIVFVSKEHACDCTKKKLETATAGLTKLLGEPPRVPIETYKIDLEPDKVEPYRQLRPIMAVPAIYFLDAKGGLIEMLQGEITDAQLSQVLGK